MKKAILLTAFGTSNKADIERCLYPIRDDIKKEFKLHDVFIVFTSKIIREKLLLNHDMQIFTLEGSLKRLEEKGYEEVRILPLYLIENKEHMAIKELISQKKDSFKCLSLLDPLLMLDNNGDLKNTEIVISAIKNICKANENILFAGHGIKNNINTPFIKLKEELYKRNFNNIYFSTFDGSPSFDEISLNILKDGVKEIVLTSFLIFSGYHSKLDIFGDIDESYYSKLKSMGIEVYKDMLSLGEREEFRQVFVTILRENISN